MELSPFLILQWSGEVRGEKITNQSSSSHEGLQAEAPNTLRGEPEMNL